MSRQHANAPWTLPPSKWRRRTVSIGAPCDLPYRRSAPSAWCRLTSVRQPCPGRGAYRTAIFLVSRSNAAMLLRSDSRHCSKSIMPPMCRLCKGCRSGCKCSTVMRMWSACISPCSRRAACASRSCTTGEGDDVDPPAAPESAGLGPVSKPVSKTVPSTSCTGPSAGAACSSTPGSRRAAACASGGGISGEGDDVDPPAAPESVSIGPVSKPVCSSSSDKGQQWPCCLCLPSVPRKAKVTRHVGHVRSSNLE